MRKSASAALFLLLCALPARAQAARPAEVLTRLFEEGVDAVDYSEAFRQAVPGPQLRQVLADVGRQLGGFQRVEGGASPYTLVFEAGTATAHIRLDERGRIEGLLLSRITPSSAGLEEALGRLRALEGEVSFLLTANGRPLAAHRDGERLAVGSAFKLAVLAAVREAVSRGELGWEGVVGLRPEWRSLPGGILQGWPAGTAVTVETLATLMISISDNTAADALIALVGRGAVERQAPANRPFLTTRELFVLKDPANRALLQEYLGASETGRRGLLERLRERPLPDVERLALDPAAPGVEWFFTTGELCALLERVADLPLTGVNPGVADPDEWRQVAFKGGSEPGVLNLTTRVVSRAGTVYCLSVTQNQREGRIDEARLIAACRGVLEALRGGLTGSPGGARGPGPDAPARPPCRRSAGSGCPAPGRWARPAGRRAPGGGCGSSAGRCSPPAGAGRGPP